MEKSPDRVASLDYLRGLAALAVMLFHFEKWGDETWGANSFLGKSGVYAVAVFFVLSGLTLTLVYEKSLNADPRTWLSFWVKRVFRIFPLLWLVTAATIFLDETPHSVRRILLNFSGLFGFFEPAGDIALGAWSIGVELVCYAAFPFLLWLGLQRRTFFTLVFSASLVIGGCYAFAWISPSQSVTAQWPVYVEPLNHTFFFLAGMSFGLWKGKMLAKPPAFWERSVALCLLLYVFYTPGNDPVTLITGVHRAGLSVLVLGFAAAWYGTRIQFTSLADNVLRRLGEMSYSVYLLHPLVHRSLKALDTRFGSGTQEWLFLLAVLATLAASHFSYHFLEKPAMKWGRKITRGITPAPAGQT